MSFVVDNIVNLLKIDTEKSRRDGFCSKVHRIVLAKLIFAMSILAFFGSETL